MKTLRFFPVFSLVFSLILMNCRTAQKRIERGDYDSAISFCVSKLAGKKKKDADLVQGLELAFQKAQADDLAEIKSLETDGRASNWLKINELHRKIQRRQIRVMPLTPLVASNGYTAEFAFLDIEILEKDSRRRAAQFLYDDSKSLLAQAEKGDRLAARKAFDELQRLENYEPNFADSHELLKDARSLGTTRILFQVKNESASILPSDFASRILELGKRDLDSEWKSYYFEKKQGQTFDYEVVFKVKNVDISPERISEREHLDEREITDGFDYVLDKKGNVMKDSFGNDLKIPRKMNVRARVVETEQTKSARLAGWLDIFDFDGKTRLDRRDMGTEIVFSHQSVTFSGDERALSEESKCRLGNRPVPFPFDLDMLADAADRLKPDLRDELRRSRAIL